MGEVLSVTVSCGWLRRLSFYRRYRRVENESHRDHCGSPQSFQLFHSQKTDPFLRTSMHFLGMTKAAVSHLRVSDVLAQLDYNGFPFWKSRSRSNFPLGEYGIRRILFHFLWAGQKFSPQSTCIRFPDKTERIQSVAVLPLHHEFLPQHPDIFCNIALDHFITDYAATRVLQQERFWTSRAAPGGRRIFFLKSFENFSNFPIQWTLYAKKCYFVHTVLSYYGSKHGSNGLVGNCRIFSSNFSNIKRKEKVLKS